MLLVRFLRAGENRRDQRSRSQNTGGSIGAVMGSSGAGMQVSATVGGGTGDGMDLSHSTSHVNAGQTARLISGHDANLIGAQVNGHGVVADIGHDLTIRSLQDSSTYHSHDKQVGGSVTTGAEASVNARYSASTVNGDYASVRDQSGIQAGDGGFDVNVQGNTDLQGGAGYRWPALWKYRAFNLYA